MDNDATPSRPAPRRTRPALLSTRVLLTCAAIGAAGGILVVGLNYLSLAAVAFPIIIGGTIGIWVLPVMIAQALLRLPLVGLVTSLVMALINAPLTPFGFAQIPSMLLFGLLLELPFLLTLYRQWGPRMFYISHTLALLATTSVYYVAIDISAFSPWLVVGMWALALACALLFTWLAQLIAARLRAAGLGVTKQRVTKQRATTTKRRATKPEAAAPDAAS